MSAAVIEHAPSSIRRIRAVGDLVAIFDEAIDVVVLRDGLDPRVRSEANAALAEPTFRRVVAVEPDASGRAALFASLPEHPALAADVHRWVEILAELTGCELVGVRLARVASAMCPRLHVDKVTLRVVRTFVGQGTEFVEREGVDRRLLATDDPRLLHPGARVERAKAGDVVLLKGETWPGHEGKGAVHRSPPASANEPRLVLTLDPLDRS